MSSRARRLTSAAVNPSTPSSMDLLIQVSVFTVTSEGVGPSVSPYRPGVTGIPREMPVRGARRSGPFHFGTPGRPGEMHAVGSFQPIPPGGDPRMSFVATLALSLLLAPQAK